MRRRQLHLEAPGCAAREHLAAKAAGRRQLAGGRASGRKVDCGTHMCRTFRRVGGREVRAGKRASACTREGSGEHSSKGRAGGTGRAAGGEPREGAGG
eukprot:2052939-Rhodomonas_salina.1